MLMALSVMLVAFESQDVTDGNHAHGVLRMRLNVFTDSLRNLVPACESDYTDFVRFLTQY